MTKKQYDDRTSDLIKRIKNVEVRYRDLMEQLQNKQLTAAEQAAIEDKIARHVFQLELASDQFDALLTKHLAATKDEAEHTYGKPEAKA